jgi:hypothetical protein
MCERGDRHKISHCSHGGIAATFNHEISEIRSSIPTISLFLLENPEMAEASERRAVMSVNSACNQEVRLSRRISNDLALRQRRRMDRNSQDCQID